MLICACQYSFLKDDLVAGQEQYFFLKANWENEYGIAHWNQKTWFKIHTQSWKLTGESVMLNHPFNIPYTSEILLKLSYIRSNLMEANSKKLGVSAGQVLTATTI